MLELMILAQDHHKLESDDVMMGKRAELKTLGKSIRELSTPSLSDAGPSRAWMKNTYH